MDRCFREYLRALLARELSEDEMLSVYDADGNGELSKQERKSARADRKANAERAGMEEVRESSDGRHGGISLKFLFKSSLSIQSNLRVTCPNAPKSASK